MTKVFSEEENLHGIRVVKSFIREDHEINKFTGISDIIYKSFVKAEKLLAFNSPLMQIGMTRDISTIGKLSEV